MNKVLVGFLLLTLTECCVAQSEMTSVECYLIEWDGMPKIARNPRNFQGLHHYFFKDSGPDFYLMFDDLNDCAAKLESGDKIEGKGIMKSMAQLIFPEGKIEIYFDSQGNYFFKKKWYRRHDGLYYRLFCFFSDELISREILDKARDNMKNEFWSD